MQTLRALRKHVCNSDHAADSTGNGKRPFRLAAARN